MATAFVASARARTDAYRGIDRGDLPASTDIVFTLDVIVGAVFQRTLVVPEPMTGGLDQAIIDLILPTPNPGNSPVTDIGGEAAGLETF